MEPERTTNDRFVQLVQRLDPGARLLRAWGLTGGVSAAVTALEIERADGTAEKLIVRQHGEVDLAQNPNVAADEYALLQILHAEGLPTPALHYVDASGEIFGTPCIVIDFIEGTTDFAPATVDEVASELAHQLARIHAIDVSHWDLSFLPRQVDRGAERLAARPAKLDDALDEGRIRDTLKTVWPLQPRNGSVLLHGDFWPGNTLWRDGRLTGIIDWEDAGIGDPLADLANTRLEMLLMLDPSAVDTFTKSYLTLNPIDTTDLPYWELCAALRPIAGMPHWGLDHVTLQTMRAGLKTFIVQAFDVLQIR
jgi:aminoglycoside phosphotransferase (APT) family kinase protein